MQLRPADGRSSVETSMGPVVAVGAWSSSAARHEAIEYAGRLSLGNVAQIHAAL